jgi:hypothetical protein
MEPKSSLPYSQVPATCPYPEPAPSSPIPYCYEAYVYFVVYNYVSQITVFTWMQDEVFSLTLVLKYVRSYKFAYKAPNWIVPNQATLIQTMWGQTQACITKLSREMCSSKLSHGRK